MKRPRRLALAALLGVPLALFFVAWRANERRPQKLGVHSSCTVLKFSSDGNTLISASSLGSHIDAVFWDLRTKQPIHHLWANADGPMCFSPDGQHVARLEMRTHDTEVSPIVVITSASGKPEKWFPDRKSRPGDVNDENVGMAWTKDGREIIALTRHNVRRFDAQTGHVTSCFPVPRPTGEDDDSAFANNFPCLSPDGQIIGNIQSPYQNPRAAVWASRTIKKLGTIVPTEGMLSLVFSPASRYVAVVEDPDVQFQPSSGGKTLWTWKTLASSQIPFAFSSDEKFVVACNGSECVARDTQTGRELWRTKNPNSPTFALSPDGNTLAEVKRDGRILLWPLPKK